MKFLKTSNHKWVVKSLNPISLKWSTVTCFPKPNRSIGFCAAFPTRRVARLYLKHIKSPDANWITDKPIKFKIEKIELR